MTQHFPTRQLRFFLTAPSPCPYLPGREERKVFAHLPLLDGASVNDALTQGGFRRSQNIAYRPACESCSACVSARLPVRDYLFSRSERRVLQRNDHLGLHSSEHLEPQPILRSGLSRAREVGRGDRRLDTPRRPDMRHP